MALFDQLGNWRDERNQLVELHRELDDLIEAHHRTVNERNFQTGDEEYQRLSSAFMHEFSLLNAAIRQIETARTIRVARRWRVPLPDRDWRPAHLSNEWWEWHSVHEAHYLTEAGMARVRREIYMERDMKWKPWLSWAAIAISVTSLLVSVLRQS